MIDKLGWFNSIHCCAAKYSLGAAAYVLPDPIVRTVITGLAKATWPAITFAVLSLHLGFVLSALAIFWHGAILYTMNDDEHENWQSKTNGTSRKNLLPITGDRNKKRRMSI